MTRSERPNGTIVGQRYRLEGRIGRGGMADVYRAVDTTTLQTVALKQLRDDANETRYQQARELFRREFHTLVQLAHPRVVTALDYGVDANSPYYTMELLDGGDLVDRAPLDWRAACSIARDVCSALSLVHSRRMVYRDLSPRNVRCTSDGKGKLIDFGAMAPMGLGKLAVCTPAVAAPEVVRRQQLDGRSDLYALGAALYRTIAGRNPYPARTFHQLEELWRHPLRPLSDWVQDVPRALDALLSEMLQLDPDLRPASAAEVAQRLSAIAGLDQDEQLLVSQAYLTTPTLVGRDTELRRAVRWTRRLATRNLGAAVRLRGQRGSGRSRFLDAVSVQAKLAGLTVVRTAAADSNGTFADVIVGQLLELLPEATQRAAAEQGEALAGRIAGLTASEERSRSTLDPEASAAARRLVHRVARQHPLLIAVDDYHRLDVISASLVALLAHEARHHPILLVATSSDRAAQTDADRMLSDACSTLELTPLELAETRKLFASIFGDVPNLDGFVGWAQSLADGNPQDLMRLAQHALDNDIVRYGGGTWSLPERISETRLPESMTHAFASTVAALDSDAHDLASTLALCELESFSVEECRCLTSHGDYARVFRSLDALLTATIVAPVDSAFALAAPAWAPVLTATASADQHLRLAGIFEKRGDGLQAARHLFEIGENDHATDHLVRHAQESYAQTSENPDAYVTFLATLPKDWRSIYLRGLDHCRAHRPARDVHAIEMRLAGIYTQMSLCSDGLQATHTQALARNAGLDLYESTDAALPAAERMKTALALAAQRYENTPERDRVHPPGEAIAQLARGVISVIGNFSRTLDFEEWRRVPSLAPLAPLSPMLAVVHQLALGFEARSSGRFEDACAIYSTILESLDAGGGAGLPQTFIDAMRAALPNIIGLLDAVLGLPSSERWALEVEKFPLYHGSALAIRTLYELCQGNVLEAVELGRRRELYRLEQPRQEASDVLVVLWTLQAHAACDDLTHTRQGLDAVERIARTVRSWAPVAAWARGEYERIRGDHAAALAALDAALEQLPAGKHQIWPVAAAARLKTLNAAGRHTEARRDGERYLATAEEANLGYAAHFVRMPLAVALAHEGQRDAAREHARRAVEGFEALGARGVNLGLAYEAAAMVAQCLGDDVEFTRCAEKCKQQLLRHHSPALAAKCRRLTRTTEQSAPRAEVPAEAVTLATSRIASVLQACASSAERLRTGLQLLTGAEGRSGYLYGLLDGAVCLRAQSHDAQLPEEVHEAAIRYLERVLFEQDAETGCLESVAGTETNWATGLGAGYRPLLLTHTNADGFVISGLVVLECGDVPPPRPSTEVVTELSRFVVENGDLTAHVVL